METYRYEELARLITALVDRGTLTPGARAPSLREISRDQNVSMATAMQAYRLLEDRGILQARPQSGFYVARRPLLREAPSMSRPPARATDVSVSGVIVSCSNMPPTPISYRSAAPSRAPICSAPADLIGCWRASLGKRATPITSTPDRREIFDSGGRLRGVRCAGAEPFHRTISS